MEKPYNIPDVKTCMPLMFGHNGLTYDVWRQLFQTYCIALGVIDHIQDTNEKPVDDDPEWNRMDSIVKLWIFGTIARSHVPLISTNNATARQVWTNFETLFREKRATIFKNRLVNLKLNDLSVTGYCTRIKIIADRLDNLKYPVSENDLVIYTINGLSPKFDYIANIIRHRLPLPCFVETRDMLLLEESRMSQIILLLNHLIMLPDIFFKARIPGDLKAAHYSQVLGEGYQVLSDPEKGESYHKIGKAGVPDDTMVDRAAVFGMLFGSDLFEDYIGKLYMAAMLEDERLLPEILKTEVQERMREFQKEREAKLRTILKNWLQPYVKGEKTEFVNWATSEARHLSQAPFGEAMLHTIGHIYKRQAARGIGKDKLHMFSFLVEWIRDIGHQMKSEFSAFRGYVSLMEIQRELKKLNNSEGNKEKIMKAVEEKKDQMVNSLWQINVVDIGTTLSHVCQAVLEDPTISKDELKQLAIGMKKLGTILLGGKKTEGAQVQSASASK